MNPLRILLPLLLSILATWAIDRLTRRRGLEPPGFALPATGSGAERAAALRRRGLALGSLFVVLYLAVFQSLTLIGMEQPAVDFDALPRAQLFLLHLVLALGLVVWYRLAFPGAWASQPGADWRQQLGLATERPLVEVGIGVLAGLAAWGAVLTALIVAWSLLVAVGGEQLLPDQPPGMVVWIAGLPLGLRLAVSASAGLVEEVFFRGFLQPRVGIPLSTLLFVLAHMSYEQPFMLLGITLLSLVFAGLVRWRQNVWAAVTAHAVFDAVQLVFLIPWAVKLLDGQGGAG